MDLRPLWPFLLRAGLHNLLLALCTAGAAAWGALRHPEAARAVVVRCCAYIAAVDVLTEAGFAAGGEAREACHRSCQYEGMA